MRVGLLTFHDANNYGAVLQAYALQETIRSLGYTVEVIDYKQDYIIDKYKTVRIKSNGVGQLFRSTASTLIHYHEFSKRASAFNSFRDSYLLVSNRAYRDIREVSGYDVYISGSDQVWNPQTTHFDEAFFLNICDDSVKLSYAASLGRDEITDEERAFIKNHIDNLDYISVREESAKRIVGSLTEKKVERVLDPTLLADRGIWKKFLRSNDKGKYVLVYSVGPVNDLMDVAYEVGKHIGMKTFCITEKALRNRYHCKRLRGVTPEDWLTLINNAEFVVTNSFHGTAFSIIFNKDFIAVPHRDTGARVIELLSLFGLNARLVRGHPDNIVEQIRYRADAYCVNEILEREKKKSLDFLSRSISGRVGFGD